MDVNDIYAIARFAVNDTVNGDISPSDFNRIITIAEYAYVNNLLGAPQQYQYQRPEPRIQYSMNENIRQKLTPLINEPDTLTIRSNGKSDYPEDYLLTDAMYTTDLDPIRFASQDKLSSLLKSTIDPVATYPIYLIQNEQFQFYPINLGSALISYVKSPQGMFWNSTKDSNGRDIYSVSGSRQPIWQPTDLMEILVRALSLIGVNLQLPSLYQYAENIKDKGE